MLLAVLLAICAYSQAQLYYPAYPYGGYPYVAQPYEGHYRAAEAGPPPCPPEVAKPENVPHCNWIPLQDKRGCILDYECEPVTPSPCPDAPVKPDSNGRCKWTAIKDQKDCLIDWVCEPIGRRMGAENPFFGNFWPSYFKK